MEIITNLHWIKGLSSNIYLWEGEDGLIMVDSGRPGDADRITGYIESIGHDLAELMGILITHADYDHAGSVAAIQERSGAIVYTGEQSAELLSTGKSPVHFPRVMQILLDRFFHYPPLAKNTIREVEDREAISDQSQWMIISTPGHSPDHHSFYSSINSILFAGDALKTSSDRPQISSSRISSDPVELRKSAMSLLRLNPSVFACGHGPPVHGHSAEMVMALARQLDG
jgi:glyoxylase-like metal-dependent hydrolase (beta-lactamase superfamily II)